MKGMWPMAGWVILGLALLASVWLDFANATQSGAIDLRNRITGARLLEHHIDPYFYKWHRPEPEEYCDPYNNPNLKVSKTTASPTLLVLHFPLANFPYRLGQLGWFMLQWLLLLGTGWLWLRRCTTPLQQLLLASFIVGFTYTAAWRLHAERGQSYVLLLFFFAAWLSTTFHPKHGNGFLAGFGAGFLIALRPPFILLLPFLALHRRGQLLGVGAGLLVGAISPMFWMPSCWSNYFAAMQGHSEIYRTEFSPPGIMAWPQKIEGIPTESILAYIVPIPFTDFSFHRLLLNNNLEPAPALPILLIAVIPFGVWLWLTRKFPAEKLLAGLAAWFFIIDLFLPAYRNNYNDVLILNVIALGLIGTTRLSWTLWPAFLALPFGWWIYVTLQDEKWVINLPSFLYTLTALLFILPIPQRQAKATPLPRRKRR